MESTATFDDLIMLALIDGQMASPGVFLAGLAAPIDADAQEAIRINRSHVHLVSKKAEHDVSPESGAAKRRG